MRIDKELRRLSEIVVSVADKNGDLLNLYESLENFENLFASVQGLRQLIYSENIDSGIKKKIFLDLFEGRISPYLIALLNYLIDANKLSKLPSLIHYMKAKAERILRKRQSEVITAFELDETLKKSIDDAIRKLSQGEVNIVYKLDPELIGGLQLRVGDTFIDASIRGKLERFKNSVKARL
ncbi:MAG: ATP synthase F1 subunit delta [Actinobacteria bacterium]|nr:ATP synthase F1 subunit delta [Actinomycetota bacterium]